MSSLLRLKTQEKYFLKSTSNSYITLLFLSNSFGIETTNTFLNHTRFQTKMGKIYTRFQNGAETIPFVAAHTYTKWLLYRGVPPPSGDLLKTFELEKTGGGLRRSDYLWTEPNLNY